MSGKKALRIRWRRIATFIILAYLLYWTGVSLHHILAIHRQERALSQRIAQVQAQNRMLARDIHTLHNPRQLKQILTGQAPLPSVDP